MRRHPCLVIGKIDDSRRAAIINIADHVEPTTWPYCVMTRRRPRVLVGLGPPLLADLLQRALDDIDLDVIVDTKRFWRLRRWDVAVLLAKPTSGRRYVVALPGQRLTAQRVLRTAPDFSSLVSLVRWLCRLAELAPEMRATASSPRRALEPPQPTAS